jgi:hypothetical protein
MTPDITLIVLNVDQSFIDVQDRAAQNVFQKLFVQTAVFQIERSPESANRNSETAKKKPGI